MAGQATVTIGSKQWAVEVATTPTELTTGLSNRASIPANTGMLFDLGGVYSSLVINMQEMLFPLDIVFISNAGVVVGVAKNVDPGLDVQFTNDSLPGARYFLEVNAGEAADVEVGDQVALTGIQPSTGFDVNTMIGLAMIVMMVTVMGKVVFGTAGIFEPKHHSIHGPEREELVRQYGSWAVGRAEAMCPEDDVACVRQEAERLYTSSRMRRMMR